MEPEVVCAGLASGGGGCSERGCWVQSGWDPSVHIPCCVPYREAFTVPLIPLGLKETKDVDFSVILKVNLKAWDTRFTV